MPPFDLRNLPFLTRNMLAFEQGTTFDLLIQTQAEFAGILDIRGFTREGPFTIKHTCDGTGALKEETFRIPDIPIAVSVQDLENNFFQGGCYVTMTLMMNGNPVYQLCSGLIYSQKTLSYPQVVDKDMRVGGGQIRVASSADPAAGSELTLTVPDGRMWNVKSIAFSLVTDGTAANRRPHVQFKDGSNILFETFSDVDHAASLTRNYRFADFGAIPDTLDNTEILGPLPGNLWIDNGDTIVTVTTNLQATDNFGVMRVQVEEFWRPS